MTHSRMMALAVLAAATGCATPALADAKAAARAEQARRRAEVEALPRGAPFTVQGRTYHLVAGLRAVGMGPAEAQQETLRRAGVGPADLVEATGRWLIVRQGGPVALGAVLAGAAVPTHPVAVAAASGRLVVVPPSLAVRPGSMEDADALAQAHGLTVTSRARAIGVVFLAVPAGTDILAAARALAADPRVRTAEIEVQEDFPVVQ